MTTEAQEQQAQRPLTIEERMTRLETQQEMMLEMLRDLSAQFREMNRRLFIVGMSIVTMVGAGAVSYVINLLT